MLSSSSKLALLLVLIVAFGIYGTISVDFPIYHTAGTRALEGNLDVYPPEVSAGLTPPSTHYFRAAPAIAWLFVPFALLPLPVAAFVFFLLKVGGLAAIAVLVSRALDLPASRGWLIAFGALAAAGGYVLEELRYGNAHLLVLAALVWALYLARRGRVIIPAALIAVSIAIKLTPLILVGYLALTKRVKAAVATLAVLAAVLLLPGFVFGVSANNTLLRTFVESAVQMGDQPRNHSLRGVILRYLTSAVPEAPGYPVISLLDLTTNQATLVWMALAAVLTALLIAAVRRGVADEDAAAPLKDSMAIVAMLILSTHTQRIYFSTLYFPCCVLVGLLVKYPGSWSQRPIRLMLAASAIVGTLLPIVLPGRRLSLAYEMGSPYLFASLAIFLFIAFLIWHADEAFALPLKIRERGTKDR